MHDIRTQHAVQQCQRSPRVLVVLGPDCPVVTTKDRLYGTTRDLERGGSVGVEVVHKANEIVCEVTSVEHVEEVCDVRLCIQSVRGVIADSR